MAEIYGVKISPVWLITALIIAVVLAVATPPIPGGALACYTILLLQLEIPAQAIYSSRFVLSGGRVDRTGGGP